MDELDRGDGDMQDSRQDFEGTHNFEEGSDEEIMRDVEI